MTERVFLGLGSNLGNREQNLCTALRWLAPGCSVVAVSSLYRSGAMVLPDAPPGPDFLNAACEVVTALSPEDLLAHLQSIEHSLGRRAAPRWAARPIDIDILMYGDRRIEIEGLTVPHAAMLERAFVLIPLSEIAGALVHPVLGRTIGELAAASAPGDVELVAGPGWANVTRAN